MSISVVDHGPGVDAPARLLRVLHVVPSLHGGGLERGLLRLVCRKPSIDPESGVQVVHGVCVLQDGDESLIEQCRSTVPTWVLGSTGLIGKRIAGLRLRSVVSRFRADIVHVRSTGAWLDARIAVQGLPRTRLILGFHGRTRLEPAVRMRRMIHRWCAARASAIVSVSAHAARMLRDEWGLPGQRLRILRNGVDTRRFRPPCDPTERDQCRRLLGVDRAAQAAVRDANLGPI